MKSQKEQNYDELHNEGGEGYNPYRDEREALERAHLAANVVLARVERKDVISRKVAYLESQLRNLDTTSDLYTETTTKIDTLQAELGAILAEEQAEFTAEWTVEVTRERRTSYNARISAGQRILLADEEAQGWSVDNLRKAIKLHNL